MNREDWQGFARGSELWSRSGIWVGPTPDRLSPLALPASYCRRSYFTLAATTHDKVSMFCIPKASLLLIGLALSPSTCRTAEEAEAERSSSADQELEAAIARQCANIDTASCQDSLWAEFEAKQDMSDG